MGIISIRQAGLSDIVQLAPLFDRYRQFYGRESDLAAATEFLLARCQHCESVLFIAHEDNIPVGFTGSVAKFGRSQGMPVLEAKLSC